MLQGIRARRRTAVELIYAAYWWSVAAVLATVAGGFALLPVDQGRRWTFLHKIARLGLRSTGTRLEVAGAERLPDSACVMVANHGSLIDGALLVAALPGAFRIVVPSGLARHIVLGPLLRGANALFLGSVGADDGIDDIRKALTAVKAGERVLFFAEGRRTRRPGLLPFGLSAFATASQADVPAVPVTIRGSRSVLRPEQWFPRRAAVTVDIGSAIQPEGKDWAVAMRLRDIVREAILSRCGEPDLTGEKVSIRQ
jgi:1-acyl-sn-glycerol-3-phosphate acyltransferase